MDLSGPSAIDVIEARSASGLASPPIESSSTSENASGP